MKEKITNNSLYINFNLNYIYKKRENSNYEN